MRGLSILLGLALVALMVAGAAAETAIEKPQATPEWDVSAHPTKEGGLHCYYYEPGTIVREAPLRGRGREQQRANRFQEVEKFNFNQQMRAFAGEPVVREQPLREVARFRAPKALPGAEKWKFMETPQRTQPPRLAESCPPPELGRGAMKGVEQPQRPPTYIAQDQATVKDFSRFQIVDGCLYVRPEPPSALAQVNNRQYSPQYKF